MHRVPLLRPARLAGLLRPHTRSRPVLKHSDRSSTLAPPVGPAVICTHMMAMTTAVFSRSQSAASQATSDRTEDYVEDSEPEREERRIKEKSRRKKTRPTVQPHPGVEVIELSDSSISSVSVAHRSPVKASTNPIIIVDVSDASSEFASGSGPRTHAETSRNENVADALPEDASEGTTLDETLPSIREILGLPKAAPHPSIPPTVPKKITPQKALEAPPPRLPNREPLSSLPSHEESDEEDQGSLKLARFAYADPNALRRTVSKTPSSSGRESSTPEVSAKAKRVSTPPSHAFAQDFADADLSRIRKCVSCETSWTVRKSVANKMKHIEVCARKKKLTHETIRVLLQKELDNLPPVASTSKLPSVEPAPAVPETLLEEAVKDGQKKKAGRRRQVLQTVKSVEETRSNILDRARLLLQDTRNTARSAEAAASPASPPDVEMPPPTQVFGMSNVASRSSSSEAGAAETTQVFGRSRLGVAPVSRTRTGIVSTGADIAANSDVSPLTQVFSASALAAVALSAGSTSAASNEVPPATQAFAPSKFATTRTVTEALATADIDPLDEPISLHDTSEDEDHGRSFPRPIVISSSPSPSPNANKLPRSPSQTRDPANARRSPATPPFARTTSPGRPRRSPSPTGEDDLPGGDPNYGVHDDNYYQEQDWNNWNGGFWDPGDDACLHYVPDENGAGPSNPSPRTQVQAPDSAPRRLAAILEDLPIPSSNINEQTPGPEPPKKKTRRKKAATAADDGAQAEAGVSKDISQEDLNVKLKEAIFKDETLHLRILRYEPIHFDVFMKLATDLGIPAKRSGLKGKVRTFLDQKAIHFYGADPSKSRTRRTRHP